MKNRKVLVALSMAAFISLMPSFSLAAQEVPSPGPSPSPSPTTTVQTAVEMEWQRLHDTWQNLPKRQKDQLYKAREAVDKADCYFIDKAVDCGLLDKQIGDRMKEHIKARTARIKEDGDIPMFRRGVRSKSQN